MARTLFRRGAANGGSPPAMLRHDLATLTTLRDVYRAKLVFTAFLASLGMFFAASVVSYVVIRINAFRNPEQFHYVPLVLPTTFWLSTGFLLVVSGMLHRAVYHARRNHVQLQTRALLLAGVFAAGFVALQYEGLGELLRFRWAHEGPETKSYAICFTLALLHALHVLGGVAFLGFVIFQSARNRYDHERHWPIDNCASYWHFLDLVWIVMLATFLVAR